MSNGDPQPQPAPDPTIGPNVKRIADALEDLVALISQIEHVIGLELRARRVVSTADPGGDPPAGAGNPSAHGNPPAAK